VHSWPLVFLGEAVLLVCLFVAAAGGFGLIAVRARPPMD
jgi:hypothetical protein